MKKPLLAFACFTLLAGAAPAVQADQVETERITRTVDIDRGGTLRVNSFSGRVDIAVHDGHTVVVEAVRRGTRARLDRVKLDVHTSGSTVYVEANRRDANSWWWWGGNNVVETDLTIKVPRQIDLRINVFSAAVNVAGVDGTHNVSGFSSRLRFEDVNGSIKAHTFSGPVDIRMRNWADGRSVDVDTFSGSISLRVPESARGAVSFNSFSGRLNSDLPLTLHTGNRRNLKADLGGSPDGGRLRFKTFSGDVRIER